MTTLDELLTIALSNTLEAACPYGQRMGDIFGDDWAEMTESERVSNIEINYTGAKDELAQEMAHEARNAAIDARNDDAASKMDALQARVEAALSGIEFTVKGGFTSSRYIAFTHDEEKFVVRVSDHASPVEGGFNVVTGERHGDPDFNFFPGSEPFAALAALIA